MVIVRCGILSGSNPRTGLSATFRHSPEVPALPHQQLDRVCVPGGAGLVQRAPAPVIHQSPVRPPPLQWHKSHPWHGAHLSS